MLAYAASRRRDLADRRPHPNMMLLIIGAHVAALALVMSAKMDLPIHPGPTVTKVDFIPIDNPPPAGHPIRAPQATDDPISHPQPRVPIPSADPVAFDPGPVALPGPMLGGGGANIITEIPHPTLTPVRTGPHLLTSQSELKPPYPPTKLLNEEEGAVTVRLSIDEQGRVVAVDPVGRADPAFLDAARRHLLAHWRFKPATEDGRPISSSTVITLHFELDG